jgi:hypothetical protein
MGGLEIWTTAEVNIDLQSSLVHAEFLSEWVWEAHTFGQGVSDKNCPLPPFCSRSHSWFHPLQNKAHYSLSPTTFLCPPLALAFSQMLVKARPTKRSCCTIFSSWPASLLIKLWTWTWDTACEPPLCVMCSIFLTFWCTGREQVSFWHWSCSPS